MTAQELDNTNLYLSDICKNVKIDPVITISEHDLTDSGYVKFYHKLFSTEDGDQLAQDLEEILDGYFRHSKVYVARRERGWWFQLHISFRFDHIKKVRQINTTN